MEKRRVSECFIIQWQLHSERSRVHVHLQSATISSKLPASGHLADVWPNPSINPTTGHFPDRIATPTLCLWWRMGKPVSGINSHSSYVRLNGPSLTIIHKRPHLLLLKHARFSEEKRKHGAFSFFFFFNVNVQRQGACLILISLSRSPLIQSQALARKHTSAAESCRCCRVRRHLHNTEKLISLSPSVLQFWENGNVRCCCPERSIIILDLCL